MLFTKETIEADLKILDEKAFLIKYIFKSNNWYFSDFQNKTEEQAISQMDILKEILNDCMGIAFHNVLMVGSGKIGISLSPQKLFKQFDGDDENSDIDIALISSKYFNFLWEKIRKYSSSKYISRYQSITSSIYRGFLNEKDFDFIDEVRSDWNPKVDKANRIISQNLSIYHQVNYRVYRSWEDLEDYHLNGIKTIKRSIE